MTEADDGAWALVGALGDNDATGDAGSVFAYYRSEAGWELQAQVFAPGKPLYQGGFGAAVALSGRWAVVTEAGWAARRRAYVLRREGDGMESAWVVEAVLEPESLAHPEHLFGVSVALDTSEEAEAGGGYVAVVGAVTRGLLDPVPGAAHVFRRTSEGVWVEEAVLCANEGEIVDRFGWAVGSDAGHIAVGAYWEGHDGEDDTGGAVYVYRGEAGTWEQQERVRPVGASWFGGALALDEKWMLVGSPNEGCPGPIGYQCGAAYFYRHSATGWNRRSRVQPPDLTEYDFFGGHVALSSPYAVVTAPRQDVEGLNDARAAYLYRLDGSTWAFERLLRAPDPGRLDQFGRSAALAADTTGARATALIGTIEALGAAYALDLGLLVPSAPRSASQARSSAGRSPCSGWDRPEGPGLPRPSALRP